MSKDKTGKEAEVFMLIAPEGVNGTDWRERFYNEQAQVRDRIITVTRQRNRDDLMRRGWILLDSDDKDAKKVKGRIAEEKIAREKAQEANKKAAKKEAENAKKKESAKAKEDSGEKEVKAKAPAEEKKAKEDSGEKEVGKKQDKKSDEEKAEDKSDEEKDNGKV